jgi:hypothetical protein
VRGRRLALGVLVLVGAILVLRRRRDEFVDIQFEDGSGMRLTTGSEARALLDDAHSIVEIAA